METVLVVCPRRAEHQTPKPREQRLAVVSARRQKKGTFSSLPHRAPGSSAAPCRRASAPRPPPARAAPLRTLCPAREQRAGAGRTQGPRKPRNTTPSHPHVWCGSLRGAARTPAAPDRRAAPRTLSPAHWRRSLRLRARPAAPCARAAPPPSQLQFRNCLVASAALRGGSATASPVRAVRAPALSCGAPAAASAAAARAPSLGGARRRC